MSDVFLKVVNMSIAASWLVLAVLILRFALKKAPKWAVVLLWGIVAVRMICPVSIESVLSLIPSKETVSPEIMLDWTPEIQTGVPIINSAVNPVITEVFAPNPATSANPLQILIPVSANFWLLGILTMGIHTAVSYWLLHRKVATAVLWKDNIFQSEYVSSPFVLGIIRPRIYLPFHLEGQDLEYVIAHEQAHIRRKDHWWKPIGFLLLAIHWFNPIMWLAYVLLCRDIELACDEKVIREFDGTQKADYTQALVDCSVSRHRISACPLAFGEVGVKDRVKSVLHYKKPAFWVVILSVLICISVAVCFLTDPKGGRRDTLPKLYSHSYTVAEVTYETPVISFTMRAGENTPAYAITEDMQLMSKEVQENAKWVVHGTLKEIELTKENFDELFFQDMIWASGENAARIRRNTANAWMLVYDESVLVYVLQQNNGDVYLARGYYDYSEKDDPYSDDTSMHWLFKLKYTVSEDMGIIAVSGEIAEQENMGNSIASVWRGDPEDPGIHAYSGGKAVPVMMFPKDTSLYSIKSSIYWLDLAGDSHVPFRIYWDGKEQYGHYNVYDAETFEALDFFRPSGLDPQTYLFKNAEYGRDYIVILQMRNEDLLCFGVRVTEKKYFVVIGDNQTSEIQVTTPNSSGGCVNADGSLFKKGDTVWLESMDGLADLRGVTITALDKNGKITWSLSIPDELENQNLDYAGRYDGWLISSDSFVVGRN